MLAYKGFNSKLQCTPSGKTFQYEVGKSYEEPEADLCSKGFHACEMPLDVFSYYPPSSSRYCEVDLEDIKDQKSNDSKLVGKKIHIKAEIGLSGIINAGVKFILGKVKWSGENSSAGDRSGASATGYCSGASATGYRSGAMAVGNNCSADAGKNSVACVVGDNGKCKGEIGAGLALTEYKVIDGEKTLIHIKGIIVDGKKIKENTYYYLKNGELLEAE